MVGKHIGEKLVLMVVTVIPIVMAVQWMVYVFLAAQDTCYIATAMDKLYASLVMIILSPSKTHVQNVGLLSNETQQKFIYSFVHILFL